MRSQFWLILALCLTGCASATTTLPTTIATATSPAATTVLPASPATTTVTPVIFTHTPEVEAMITMTVLYDNLAYDTRLQTDWGFACLVEGQDATLLFDTGGKSDILLQNIRTLGFDPHNVDTVFLSHAHSDHTGGLAGFLAENPAVTVILPQSFPRGIKDSVRRAGAKLAEVTGPIAVNAWAYTTGELGGQIREQALALTTTQGVVVITGCAHPGIVTMIHQAQATTGSSLHRVLGGFHLRDSDTTQIADTIAGLQALGVQQIAPSHCTGDAAQRAFADAFDSAYHVSGAGRVFTMTNARP